MHPIEPGECKGLNENGNDGIHACMYVCTYVCMNIFLTYERT